MNSIFVRFHPPAMVGNTRTSQNRSFNSLMWPARPKFAQLRRRASGLQRRIIFKPTLACEPLQHRFITLLLLILSITGSLGSDPWNINLINYRITSIIRALGRVADFIVPKFYSWSMINWDRYGKLLKENSIDIIDSNISTDICRNTLHGIVFGLPESW